MNTDTSTNAPSINPQHLQLGKLEQYIPKTPVSDTLPRYKQSISYGGCNVSIQTSSSELHALIYSSKSLYGDAVLVPVCKWLQEQFDILDFYVDGNVHIPNELALQWSSSVPGLYMSIYKGHNIFCP